MTAAYSSEPFRFFRHGTDRLRPMQALLTVDQLAAHIHKSVASIRSDSTRNPNSLPPVCRLPGTKRLLWRIEDVERWIVQHVRGDSTSAISETSQVSNPAKPKRGRPTKAAQAAKQRTAKSAQDLSTTRVGS